MGNSRQTRMFEHSCNILRFLYCFIFCTLQIAIYAFFLLTISDPPLDCSWTGHTQHSELATDKQGDIATLPYYCQLPESSSNNNT